MKDPIEQLSDYCEAIRSQLDEVDAAREIAYRLQREVTRNAASSIRAVHRHELDEARELLEQTAELCGKMTEASRSSPQVHYSGFVLDAQKEYAEAALVCALAGEQPVPSPKDLKIEPAPYLNGMAEAAGELRRLVLDALSRDEYDEAEALTTKLQGIYDLLVTFDYPDAISQGLKRRLDMVRGVLERTVADVFTTIRQTRLQDALKDVSERLERKR